MYNKQLVLEDGTVYKGYAFGADGEVSAEIVLNTGMSGYELTLTDTNYDGKVALFTYPLIGNYGINGRHFKNLKRTLSAMIVKEICEKPSNFESEYTIDEALKEFGVIGIYGVDTRSITKKVRNKAKIKVCIADIDRNIDEILAELRK